MLTCHKPVSSLCRHNSFAVFHFQDHKMHDIVTRKRALKKKWNCRVAHFAAFISLLFISQHVVSPLKSLLSLIMVCDCIGLCVLARFDWVRWPIFTFFRCFFWAVCTKLFSYIASIFTFTHIFQRPFALSFWMDWKQRFHKSILPARLPDEKWDEEEEKKIAWMWMLSR